MKSMQRSCYTTQNRFMTSPTTIEANIPTASRTSKVSTSKLYDKVCPISCCIISNRELVPGLKQCFFPILVHLNVNIQNCL